MLLSAVLAISPLTPLRLRGHYGRAVQAWLLEQVSRLDAGLAQELHAGEGPKPYTVSTLVVPGAGRRGAEGETSLLAGQQVMLRITSLHPELSRLILDRLLPSLPQRLSLQRHEFRLHGPMTDSLWWGAAGFDDLVREAGRTDAASVTLHFASPTAFRSGQVDLNLPTPELVWRSLWLRWNLFAPEDLQIDPLWPEFAAAGIVVSDYTIRTLKVALKDSAATGCTGRVTYRLLPAHRCGDFAQYRPGVEVVFHSLAQFALFSGVGHHTTAGLGQTRLLTPSSPNGGGDDFA